MGKNLNEFFVPADNLRKLNAQCKTYKELGDLIGLSASGVRTMVTKNEAKLAYELAAGLILKQREEDETYLKKLEEDFPIDGNDPVLEDQDVKPDVEDPFDDYAGPARFDDNDPFLHDRVWEQRLADALEQMPPAPKVPVLTVFTVYTNPDDVVLLERFARTMLNIPANSMIAHDVSLEELL